MRDSFSQQKTLERIVSDIRILLGATTENAEEESLADVVTLWDPIERVAAGTNYSANTTYELEW